MGQKRKKTPNLMIRRIGYVPKTSLITSIPPMCVSGIIALSPMIKPVSMKIIVSAMKPM